MDAEQQVRHQCDFMRVEVRPEVSGDGDFGAMNYVGVVREIAAGVTWIESCRLCRCETGEFDIG